MIPLHEVTPRGEQKAGRTGQNTQSRLRCEQAECEAHLAELSQVIITGNGDVDGSGLVDLLDTVVLLRWVAGEPVVLP